MNTKQQAPALAIGMRVADLTTDDDIRGTVVAIGTRYVIIKCDPDDVEKERVIDGIENAAIVPAGAGCQNSDEAPADVMPSTAELFRRFPEFPMSARPGLHVALGLIKAIGLSNDAAHEAHHAGVDPDPWAKVEDDVSNAFQNAWSAVGDAMLQGDGTPVPAE